MQIQCNLLVLHLLFFNDSTNNKPPSRIVLNGGIATFLFAVVLFEPSLTNGAMQNLNIIVLFPNFTVEPIQVYVTYK